MPTDIGSLASSLRSRGENGRPCVPVLGAGVNIQAASMEGLANQDDWMLLLARVAREIRVSKGVLGKIPSSPLARWEYLILVLAERQGTLPYQAEAELQKIVCAELRNQEKYAKDQRLYGELLHAGFNDIISLNFDRRLALSAGVERFQFGPKSLPLGEAGETLYRHSVVEGVGDSATRIWYPHGDTRKCSSLKLGVRKYGFHLGLLEEYRAVVDSEWRKRHLWSESQPFPYRSPDVAAASWVELFLSRPLVFIGCGLDPGEWSMWWLLQRRSDATLDQDVEHAPVFYLTTDSMIHDLPHLHRLFAMPGITVVSFSSYAALWALVREALA